MYFSPLLSFLKSGFSTLGTPPSLVVSRLSPPAQRLTCCNPTQVMARLSVSKIAERRKRIVVALSVFLEMYTAVSALVLLMASAASLNSLGDNDFSFTPAQTSSARGVSSTKRKRRSIDTCEPITADSLLRAAIMLS
ncbi:PREDICTED: uncharacterized protein LOC109185136 [Ipomoea nil]|uniref:uncharacterized protein LOC109185136 n=1 Tax=Ipomoea nil TaxID=35883 RepID=UPI00090116DD|nr:PREDICTED: uncharacterized protein LOC109185136 [Ipomoea nil]